MLLQYIIRSRIDPNLRIVIWSTRVVTTTSDVLWYGLDLAVAVCKQENLADSVTSIIASVSVSVSIIVSSCVRFESLCCVLRVKLRER